VAKQKPYQKLLRKLATPLWQVPLLRRSIQSLRWKIYLADYTRRGEDYAKIDASHTIRVSPARIQDCVVREYDKWEDKGKILDGDWDLHTKPFEDQRVYRGFHEHFVNGAPWSQTEFHRHFVGRIRDGYSPKGCRSAEEFDRHCAAMDALFENIRAHGYKAQSELPGKRGTPYELYDEISVCIGRNGRFLFEDGRHRLCIAKILGLEQVPVFVSLRHKQWQDLRHAILGYAQRHGGRVYAPLFHPDLAGIPHLHGHQRFDLIKSNLPVTQGTLLDIGANWGYFCHRFEDEGFDCTAIEEADEHQYFLKKMKTAEGKKFAVFAGSIFDYRDRNRFDVVLALNVFHHFLKDKAKYEELKTLLSRLDMSVMVFEPHVASSEQMHGAYMNYGPQEFVDFILSHSCLRDAKAIGQDADGRALFVLTR
jgi:methyltransferase family protein